MTKNIVIALLCASILISTILHRAFVKNYETRIMLWQTAHDRERAEVLRLHEIIISFGVPVFVIDPNNPLRVIPMEK